MGTDTALYVFNYQRYVDVVVPAFREVVCGQPPSPWLADLIRRFETHKRRFQLPAQGYCHNFTSAQQECPCLRNDLGLKPHLYRLSEAAFALDDISGCGLVQGMRNWRLEEEPLIDLFNAAIATCLSNEMWFPRRMYLWEYELDDPFSWVQAYPSLVHTAWPLFLALCCWAKHLGAYRDPGGLQGWLTPEETRQLGDILASLHTPIPAEQLRALDLDTYRSEEGFEDMRSVARLCQVAQAARAGVAWVYGSGLVEYHV